MSNSSDLDIFVARFEQALLPPSREILLVISAVAVTINSISLAALGRLPRPLTTFRINLVNLAVSDLMLAVSMAVTICVSIFIQTKISPSQNPEKSLDGASFFREATNFTENATSKTSFDGGAGYSSDDNTPIGLLNLACFERFTVCLMSYFTLLPLMATTSLVYHQLTTVWYPLDFTMKKNKKPTAFFVFVSYFIPVVSFSVGIIFNYIKEPQDGCLATLMSQSVYLAVSGTGGITTAIAFVGNTVMLTLLLYKARKQITQGPSNDKAKKAFKTSLTIAMLWATDFVLLSTGVVAFTVHFSFDLVSSPIPGGFSIVHVVAGNLHLLNILLDPIIYCLRIPEISDVYRRILCFNNPQKVINREAVINIAPLNKRSVE